MPNRLPKALVTLAAWLGATVAVGAYLRPDARGMAEIVGLLSTGIAWNVVVAIAVLAIATRAFGWRDLGFCPPAGRSLARFVWFPLLTLLPFYAIAFAVGLPPTQAILFLSINTALVALSEEWMFRGILFQALRMRLRLWPALVLTSVLFGAVHVLNAFSLGDIRLAAAQAVAAMMTGFLLVALMLRTGSIWTAVTYHLFWNLGILLLAYETAQYPLPEGPVQLGSYLVPLLVVLPNFLYSLVLLRKLPNHPPSGPDGRSPATPAPFPR
ncbi:CPBP family intramembrane glutamic endopeptidase [Rhodobacter calidifons]|uniref:CPBP family intramembrane metalloprotease n=1 Tax=Rhodobacter calidifons TaxID=2715277 RepID=A0ABX0G4B1_9RHOB|nr:CPBP family intramembrane glutamic endopeptidase [Rhodobacter calidifons]NHB76058.1 CPBP family intramembrane metalloprotease [Rhodobacter calidifons]